MDQYQSAQINSFLAKLFAILRFPHHACYQNARKHFREQGYNLNPSSVLVYLLIPKYPEVRGILSHKAHIGFYRRARTSFIFILGFEGFRQSRFVDLF